MASNEFRHAAKQEAWMPLPPCEPTTIRSAPHSSAASIILDVTNLDGGVHLESPTTQFARNSLHQLVGWFLLVVQFGA